jgi:hypothetical protein
MTGERAKAASFEGRFWTSWSCLLAASANTARIEAIISAMSQGESQENRRFAQKSFVRDERAMHWCGAHLKATGSAGGRIE